MIISNPYKGRKETQIQEIKDLLRIELPKKVEGRKQGFGPNWNENKEEELHLWLDEITAKYEFDFRLLFSTTESLWEDDYRQFKKYL